MIRRRAVLAATLLPSAVRAAEEPVLQLAGAIARHDSRGLRDYTLPMLDALRQGRFEGKTPWTRGRVVFTGPLFSALLDDAGANGAAAEVMARNDYMAVISLAEVRALPIILATRRDGAPMSLRERGPVWIIYPMDQQPELQNPGVYARSVWQVSRITVV